MIGVIGDERTHGKGSFKDLVDYCVSNPPERVAYIGTQNLISPESAALEMEAVATQNRRCQNPVYHVILSWREMEVPTHAQIDEAVQISLSELDLQDCQALWTVHDDTENRHVHIVVNRIHPETYRAVQPAGNWSHKAIQKASRKIELLQGWEIEQNGVYTVTADGELVQKEKASTPKLSKSALDMEAHTATQSAQRIGQEIAAPRIRSAKSWRELHEKLAREGIAFEKKGSGAILVIGDTVVKASTAGRDISLSRLCERLGAFEPRDGNLVVAERKPEPVVKVTEREVKPDWERFTEARTSYFKEKGEAQNALVEKHKKERTELFAKQKEERSSLFTDSWKGKGALLNRQRSVTAARQQAEKLDLRDRQKLELDELKRRFPRRFPNFKNWLNEKEPSNEPYLSFRYPAQGAIYAEGAAEAATKAAPDLRAFTPQIANKGGVAYRRQNKNEAAFIDYGKRIVLSAKTDEAATLAAMQLACQKWGGVLLHGTDEYKRMCVALAVKHNLRISNSELAAEIATTREKTYQHKEAPAKTDKKMVFNDDSSSVDIKPPKNGFNQEEKTPYRHAEADPNSAYWAHYQDITGKTKGDRDYSRIDAMIGIRMRVTGYSQGDVQSAIETNAPAMRRENMSAEVFEAKYRYRNWRRYADETTAKYVFGARGAISYEKALPYMPLYLRLEGRITEQQQKTQTPNRGR